MAMESWTLTFVLGRAEKCVEATRFVQKRVYISETETTEENNRTTSFGEKGVLICGHIYLCKQLLLHINTCCQEVMQNNEMTSP